MTLRQGILLGGVLALGAYGLIIVMQDGEEDPPPIIVSNGGSIKVAMDTPPTNTSYFTKLWFSSTWYQEPGSHQHTVASASVEVAGATDSQGRSCAGPYTLQKKKVVIEYGSATPQPSMEVTIGWVTQFKFWDHLKFDPKDHAGEAYGNDKHEFRIDNGQAVYLKTVSIHQDTGDPIVCTFQTADPALSSIKISGHR